MTAPPPSRSHAERMASAAESFRRFVPEAEPERVAASFTRRLGPLGAFAYETVGAMWDRPELGRRDRSLFIVTTLATQARDDELVAHTQIGVRHGLTPDEIVEILPHVASLAGFPAAMAAARQIDEGLRQATGVDRLDEREGIAAMSDDDRDTAAADAWAARTGHSVAQAAAAFETRYTDLGALGELQVRWNLGQIWSRPGLSGRDRSIVAISVLVTIGALPALAEQVQRGAHARPRRHRDPGDRHPPRAVRRAAARDRGDDDRQRGARRSVMRSASALVLTEPRRFERRSFEFPDVGADDGLLRIEACGLCGTDHEQYTGDIRSGSRVRAGPRGRRHRRTGRSGGRRAMGRQRGPAGRGRGVQVVPRVRVVPGRRVPEV